MSTTSNNTYLDLSDESSGGGHQITLWWAATQPDRIHLVLTDPRLVDSQGEKPGLRLVLSSNPRSADYSPANFNRCGRLLRSLGMPAPAADVEEQQRHLRYRDKVIKTVLGAEAATVTASKTPPAGVPEEAHVCPTCSSYVHDLDVHDAALHDG